MALFNFLFGEGKALAYIIGGVGEGKSAEVIKEVLEAGNIAIRGEVVEKVVNYLNTVKLPADRYIKQLQQFNLPNIARIPLSLTTQLRNFAYHVDVQGFSRTTGEIEIRQYIISTNELITKQAAVDIATELSTGTGKRYELESGAGTVTGITQNSGGLVLP